MKLYIAGPMSGLPQHNFPAFFAAAEKLRAMGHEVINPAEVDQGETPTWAACMRNDIPLLVSCEAVVRLPGWQDSKGARLEVAIAAELGMSRLDLADFVALTRTAEKLYAGTPAL
jgi:hypothetical protein